MPGLYKWTTGVNIATGVTISGGPTSSASSMFPIPFLFLIVVFTNTRTAWIFQIAGNLGIAAAQRVTLAGGALARNIVWVVAGEVTAQAGAHMEGVILGKTAVTFVTGSSLNGRILAQTNVALQKATVVAPLL